MSAGLCEKPNSLWTVHDWRITWTTQYEFTDNTATSTNEIYRFSLLCELWQLKTARGDLMRRSSICMYNGLARPADYSIFARNELTHVGTEMDSPTRTAFWPMAIEAGLRQACWPTTIAKGLLASRRLHHDGRISGRTS